MVFCCLANQVWEQGHEARALDREGEFALMPAADAGTLAWDDLAEGGQVATQGVGIFVVDFAHVDLTEVTRARDFLGVARRVHRKVKSVDRKNNRRLRGMNVRNKIKTEYLRCEFLDHRPLYPIHHHLAE